VYLGVTPDFLQPIVTLPWSGRPCGLMGIGLSLVIAGGAVTAVRRVGRIVKALRKPGERT
jgi:hypothetical protein